MNDVETLPERKIKAAIEAANLLWAYGWYDLADEVRRQIRTAAPTCDHQWTERNQGPGFRWHECRMCGHLGDWLDD